MDSLLALGRLSNVYGVGQQKLDQYGHAFMAAIVEHQQASRPGVATGI